ncbi:heavy metal-associated isoprenylated plant protein 39-like [Bidens hawaiensis]|uniref:heavy metal-associated isoprenylated plant protein 39-like n=1 Tax=Bidens hawaiensis TaxID=980011 RepID=UPI004049F4B9
MSENKKVVVKVDVHDNKDKRNALKSVSSLQGINSIAMDMKDKKLTVIGDIDPVCIVSKLKKWHPTILTVGLAKDVKKDDKNDDDKKKKEQEVDFKKWLEYNRYYYPYYMPQQYGVRSVDEYPNNCVIC